MDMKTWELNAVGVEPHDPRILSSADDARIVLLHLPAGEELQEHEVHERARLIVVGGEVEVSTPDGERVSAGAGRLLEFAPGERRTVLARIDARLLLFLTPWPGDGHPGAMTLEEKRSARRRAAQHTGG
jgi:quercetin dioxygenase-like cupin family protein